MQNYIKNFKFFVLGRTLWNRSFFSDELSAIHLQVQAHGSDAMVDEDNCIFFLPHRPRSQICDPPFFLFMKGTGKIALSRHTTLSFLFKWSCVYSIIRSTILWLLGSLKLCFTFFLLKGWCGAGGDHYEPLIAHPLSQLSQEKVALVLWGSLVMVVLWA